MSKNRYFYGKKLLSDSSKFDDYKKLVMAISQKSSNTYSSSVMVSEMSSLFRDNSINVVSENYSKIKYSGQTYRVNADFSVEGSYNNIKGMIYSLSALSYIVNVSLLDMSMDDNDLLNANINLAIVGFNKNTPNSQDLSVGRLSE